MSLTSGPYSLITYPWGAAHRRVLRRAVPPALHYGLWTVFCVAVIWLCLCFFAPQIGMIFGEVTPALVGVAGLAIIVVLLRIRSTGLRRAFNASVFRAGPWQTTITDEGLSMTAPGVRQVLFWNHFSEVRDGPDGLLVMSGPATFVPIPATAFADEGSYLVFRSAVEARISGSKGAI
jgi:hypothetical protein